MLTIDLDLNLLSEQMERYVHELGMDGPTVVKTQTRLLLETLIRICPPHSLKQGRAAIKRDIKNALGLFNDLKYLGEARTVTKAAKGRGVSTFSLSPMAALTVAARRGDTAAVNAILRHLPKSNLSRFTGVTFTESLHTGRRNARGRVRRSTGILALTPTQARNYLKQVQGRSGQAKGAFVPALHAVGGKAASWIERHQGKHGDVDDVHLGAGELDPRLTVINQARGIRSLDDRDVSKTIRFREAAMKTHISKLLELRAKETNLA